MFAVYFPPVYFARTYFAGPLEGAATQPGSGDAPWVLAWYQRLQAYAQQPAEVERPPVVGYAWCAALPSTMQASGMVKRNVARALADLERQLPRPPAPPGPDPVLYARRVQRWKKGAALDAVLEANAQTLTVAAETRRQNVARIEAHLAADPFVQQLQQDEEDIRALIELGIL